MVSRFCSICRDGFSRTRLHKDVSCRIRVQELSIPVYGVEADADRPAKTFPDIPCGSQRSESLALVAAWQSSQISTRAWKHRWLTGNVG